MERERGRRSRRTRPPRQRDVIRDVMLSASECGTWLTLDELSKLTRYPHASISAQLRHLRKPGFGGFAVEKRTRLANSVLRREPGGPVWEYRVQRGILLRAKRIVRRWKAGR